jgi:gluconate:H+ symporter, GntP family
MTILFLLVVIVILIIATIRYKVHPFISLLMAAILIGFLERMEAKFIVDSITVGFGNTLGSIGIIIAFGTIIGTYLEYSGGAKTLAKNILRFVGEKNSVIAMNITGFVVSIPVFCDSGFVVLSTLNRALSKKGQVKLITLAIALATGLYATHVFVPPTPGPLAAAATLGADIGFVLLLGLIVAIPVSVVGIFWAKYIKNRIESERAVKEVFVEKNKPLPGIFSSALPITVPILLIALRSIALFPTHPLSEGLIKDILVFSGNPVIALLIGVLLAFRLKIFGDVKKDWLVTGLKNAGVIILITGAGGAFGNVLRETNIGDEVGSIFSGLSAGIVLPFIIAAVLKSAQGSSTVSIITTAAIILPLLSPLGLESEIGKALAVLAIGAGAMTVSHANDSYFWVVAQFSDMSNATALKTFTVASLLQGISGIITVALLALLLM